MSVVAALGCLPLSAACLAGAPSRLRRRVVVSSCPARLAVVSSCPVHLLVEPCAQPLPARPRPSVALDHVCQASNPLRRRSPCPSDLPASSCQGHRVHRDRLPDRPPRCPHCPCRQAFQARPGLPTRRHPAWRPRPACHRQPCRRALRSAHRHAAFARPSCSRHHHPRRIHPTTGNTRQTPPICSLSFLASRDESLQAKRLMKTDRERPERNARERSLRMS